MSEATPDEGGFTLIELLISVMILGIAFAGIIGVMATMILGSDYHRNQARGGTILVASADNIKAQGYIPCPTATPYAAPPVPAGWHQTIAVAYWNPGTSSYGACAGTDGDLQRVTVTLTSPNGRVTESVDLVKRSLR